MNSRAQGNGIILTSRTGRRDAFAFLFADSRLPYPFAISVGLALACWLIPPEIWLGGLRLTEGSDGDVRQHIIGQRYFIGDSWHWPLLVARGLGGPQGTNIAFTDSIPAMAILARLLRPLLPPGGHLVLAWLALSYVLQPVAAVFALRGFGERGRLAGVTIAVLAASTHALLARHGHPALSGHFLVLLALGLYARLCDGPRRPALIAAPLLMTFSLLIHPYLMAMASAVLAAAPLTLFLRHDEYWRTATKCVATGLAATAVLGVALGHFGAISLLGQFGHASMNLVSPFRPASSTLFPSFGPVLDATGGQSEGANYLGAGGLLLAGVAGAILARGRAIAVRRHAGLLTCCLGLTLFALSNRIYAGHHLLLSLPPPPRLLGQFQSTGRFFWPVGYTIVLAGAAAVARMQSRRVAAAVLVCAAGLQFADMAALRDQVHGLMREPLAWQPETPALRALLAKHRRLALEPLMDCGMVPGIDPIFSDLVLAASERLVPVNSMWAARIPLPPLCGDDGYEPVQDGELRVYMPGSTSGPLAMPDGGRSCGLLGRVAVCTKDAADLSGLPPIPVPTIATGQRLAAGSEGDTSALVWGWSMPGPGGTWSDGKSAMISGRLTQAPERPADLTIWCWAYSGSPDRKQRITVFFNEQKMAEWTVPVFKNVGLHAPLPGDADLTTRFAIRLAFATPGRPAGIDHTQDWRRLGIWLKAYRIGTATAE